MRNIRRSSPQTLDRIMEKSPYLSVTLPSGLKAQLTPPSHFHLNLLKIVGVQDGHVTRSKKPNFT